MMEVIIGGSGSGKSAYAESRMQKLLTESQTEENPILYYVATMKPDGEEGRKRVERHQRLRQGKPFVLIERDAELETLELANSGLVLLECMSNLVANEWFAEEWMNESVAIRPSDAKEQLVKKIMDGVKHLKEQSLHLIIVTNEISSDGAKYAKETTEYMQVLGAVNQMLAKHADQVTEVVYGIPINIKEEK